jgi:hypothetical protein
MGQFKKFLKMNFGQLSLALEVTSGSRYALLTEVASFLIANAIVGSYGNVTGLRPLPFPGTLGGGLGGYNSATVSGHFHVA